MSVRAVAAALCLCLATAACAHIDERRSLRAEPLEPARPVKVDVGPGLAVAGERRGAVVHVRLEAVRYCAVERQQRVRGYRVVERRAVGRSLQTQWLFGGLLTATGAGLIAWTVLEPPTPVDDEVSLKSQGSGYAYAGGITAVGLALLGAATWQQLGLGTQETPLGEQILKKRERMFICAREPANTGQVRLTLSDGTQIEAAVPPGGATDLALPEDIETRLEAEGRRATLEAIGDPRAQVRIAL